MRLVCHKVIARVSFSLSFSVRNGKASSLLVHLCADYRYSFSVPRCRYKLINLRTRFLCIMATFAGTLCLVPEESVGRLLYTVFPRVLFGRAPRRYPCMNIDTFLHTRRYVMRTYS